MTEKVEKKSKDFKPDFGSAVLSVLIGCLMQQNVLEELVGSSEEPKLPEVKLDELRKQLTESRKMLTRGLKHVVPDLPDDE